MQELAEKKAELEALETGNVKGSASQDTRSVDELLSFIGAVEGSDSQGKAPGKGKKKKAKKKKGTSTSPPSTCLHLRSPVTGMAALWPPIVPARVPTYYGHMCCLLLRVPAPLCLQLRSSYDSSGPQSQHVLGTLICKQPLCSSHAPSHDPPPHHIVKLTYSLACRGVPIPCPERHPRVHPRPGGPWPGSQAALGLSGGTLHGSLQQHGGSPGGPVP